MNNLFLWVVSILCVGSMTTSAFAGDGCIEWDDNDEVRKPIIGRVIPELTVEGAGKRYSTWGILEKVKTEEEGIKVTYKVTHSIFEKVVAGSSQTVDATPHLLSEIKHRVGTTSPADAQLKDNLVYVGKKLSGFELFDLIQMQSEEKPSGEKPLKYAV